ncbi:uncharacterized protein FTOL_11795 [Fusarium torulosum]|uniref:Uncharacterized protein n=1 Tax=Fusarium torulosum TaxID=33205 RepID=A0AAE8MKM4_9HYPO|nr:uncharacterized protein FTOL_11795 [Fusarium torulosum]
MSRVQRFHVETSEMVALLVKDDVHGYQCPCDG